MKDKGKETAISTKFGTLIIFYARRSKELISGFRRGPG
jgi:hypothetical protein